MPLDTANPSHLCWVRLGALCLPAATCPNQHVAVTASLKPLPAAACMLDNYSWIVKNPDMSLVHRYVTFAGISLEDKTGLPEQWTDKTRLGLGLIFYKSKSQGSSEPPLRVMYMVLTEH